MRIKVFQANLTIQPAEQLEREVNVWLAQNPGIAIRYYTHAQSGRMDVNVTITIAYDESSASREARARRPRGREGRAAAEERP